MNLAENKPRPKFLTWLCIGSAIFGVFWIIMLLTLIIFSIKGHVPPGLFPGLAVEYAKAGYLFMVALILLTMLGLLGIRMMWKLKMSGFYLYTTAKTLVYFLPVVFIGSNHLTFIGLITTSIFIVFYGTFFMARPSQSNTKK